MNVAERTYAWAQAVSRLPKRTIEALAAAFHLDPTTLVHRGYQVEASTPPGVEQVVFVPGRTAGEIAYVELAVDTSIDELAMTFGPGRQLPARSHGGGRVAFDGIFGLTVVAGTYGDRVHSLTFILMD